MAATAGNNLKLLLQISPDLDVKSLNVMLKHLKQSLGALGKDIKPLNANQINAELSKIQANVKGTTVSFQSFDKKLDTTAQKTQNFGGLLGKAFAFNQIAQSMQAITSAVGQFTAPFVELDKQVQNIGTLGRENFREFAALTTELSTKVPDDAATIAEGVYQAISAGMEGTNQQLIEFVEIASKAGVAGLSNTADAVDGITSVINAYGMTVDDAQKVSDIFFAGIKTGKTTFSELNASIATFVPNAAAVGVSFEEATAAIASMTAMGTPTAQAATQIRAAMVLVQKGGPGLNKALKEQGRSLTEFQEMLAKAPEEGGGLINTLEEIRKVVAKSGQTLPEATGRIEAASAIMQLAGDNYQKAVDKVSDVRFEVIGEASMKAFDVASESIASRTAGVLSSVQAMFNKAFLALGSGSTTALNTLTQLSPAIVGLTSVTSLMGGTFSKVAVTMLSKLIPSLVTTDKATKISSINWSAMWTAATGGIILLIAGLVAVGVALVKLYQEVEGVKDFFDQIFAHIKAMVLGVAQGIVNVATKVREIFTAISERRFGDALKAGNSLGDAFVEGFTKGATKSLDKSNIDKSIEKLARDAEDIAEINVKINAANDFDSMIDAYEKTVNEIEKIELTPPEMRTEEQEQQLEKLTQRANKMSNEIGKAAPGATDGIKDAVVQNGELIDVYEINIKAAREFGKENRKAFSKDMQKEQKEYADNIGNMYHIYKRNEDTIKENAKQVIKLRKEGKNDEANKVQEETNELIKQNAKTREAMVKGYRDGLKNQYLSKKAEKEIGNALGINSEEQENIKNNQVAVNDELTESKENVLSIGDAFNQAFQMGKQEQSKAVAELAGYIKQYEEGELTKEEYEEKRAKALNTAKQATKDIIEYEKYVKEAKRQAGIQDAKSTKAAKSQLSIAQDKVTRERESIDANLEQYEINSEMLRLQENRKKNDYDELNSILEQNKAIEAKKNLIKETYNLDVDDEGKILDIGIRLNKDENKDEVIDDLQKEIDSLNRELAKNDNSKIKIQTSIDDAEKEIDEKLKALQRKQLEYQIELGTKTDEDLLIAVKNDIAEVQDEILAKQEEINNATNEGVKQNAEKQLITLKETLIEYQKAWNNLDEKIRADKLKLFMENEDKKFEVFKDRLDRQRELDELASNTAEKVGSRGIDLEFEKDLAKLETLKEKELIMEDEYNRKKEALEEEHRKRLQVIQAMAEGQRIEAKRQADQQELEYEQQKMQKEKARLTKELEYANEKSQKIIKLRLKALETSLEETANKIETNGNLIKANSELLANSVQEIFGSLFADEETMKEPWRRLFSVTAGALKQYLVAVATKMVFGTLDFTNANLITGAFLVPAFKGLANALLGKLLDPVVSGLLSFSGGGKIDKPTAAIVGDNPYSPEWVLRDFDIQAIIQSTLKTNNASMKQLFDSLIGPFNYNLPGLINEFKRFNDNVLRSKEFFKPGEFTAENLIVYANDAAQMNKLAKSYRSNSISKDDYISSLESIQLKVNSYANGSPSLNNPELAIVGDSVSKERVLNDPDLKAIIQEASLQPVLRMEKAINRLEGAISDQKVYILENDIGKSYDKYNYKKVSRERGL